MFKIIHSTITVFLFLSLISILGGEYIFFDFPIYSKPLVEENPRRGGELVIEWTVEKKVFCDGTAIVRAKTSPSLSSGGFFVGEYSLNWPVGSYKKKSVYNIPDHIPPGFYWLSVTLHHECSRFLVRRQHLELVYFSIHEF